MGNTNSEFVECINEHHVIRSKLDPDYPIHKFEKLDQEIEKLEENHDLSFIDGNTEKAERISKLITNKKQEIWNLKVLLNKEFV